MSELAVRNVEHDSFGDLAPIGVMWQKDKLRFPIYKLFDQPRARDAIDFNFLASDPFHSAQFLLRQNLQSDVRHRVCVADNVPSTREEQVEVLVQFPSAADVEREICRAAAFCW